MNGLVKSPKLFEEDVAMLPGSSKCVVVVESYADDYSDEDDEDENEVRLQEGTVRVAFYPTGEEKVMSEEKLELVDRSLMPGDIVRHMDGESGMKGYVTDCRVACSVHIKGTNKMINGVDSKSLHAITVFNDESQYVGLDGWIGKTLPKRHKSKVTLRLASGQVTTVDSADLEDFEDLFDEYLSKGEESEFAFLGYYKGQRLMGCINKLNIPPSRLKNSVKKKKGIVTVTSVEATQVAVKWLMCGGHRSPKPSQYIAGEDINRLKLIDEFEYAATQVGDSYYYTISSEDTIESITTNEPYAASRLAMDTMFRKNLKSTNQEAELNSANEELKPNPTVDTKSVAADPVADTPIAANLDMDVDDVASADSLESGEDDGEDEEGWEDVDEESTKSSKSRQTNKPAVKRKQKRSYRKSLNTDVNLDIGDQVAVEVLCTETTVAVMWQDGSVQRDIVSRDLYPIYHLDDNEFFPGDYVMPARHFANESLGNLGVIVSVNESQRVADVKWFHASPCNTILTPRIETEAVSVYELKDHDSYSFRPGAAVVRVLMDEKEDMQCCERDTVGSVQLLGSDGLMSIHWIDGCVSQCYPHQLIRVSNTHESDDESDDDSDDESGDTDSWSDDSDISAESLSGDIITFETLNNLGSSLSTLMSNYQRVLEPLQEMQKSRYLISWAEFNKVLLPLHKVPDVYMKMIKLDYSLETTSSISINSGSIENFQRLVKKAAMYTKLSQEIHSLSSSLTDSSTVPLSSAISTFSKNLSGMLEGVANGDAVLDKKYIDSFIHLEHEIAKLPSFLPHAGDIAYVPMTEKLCADMGYEYTNTSSEPPADTLDALTTSITDTIANLDNIAKSDVQLQMIDFLCDFFTQMKEVTSTVLEMYKSSECTAEAESQTESPQTGETEQVPDLITFSCTGEELTNGVQAAEQKLATPEEPQASLVKPKSSEVCLPATDSTHGGSEQENGSEANSGGKVEMMSTCPPTHRYQHLVGPSSYPLNFMKHVRQQLKILNENLTDGIIIKTYEDRMDCLSAMILGPKATPYEDGIFMFDIHLTQDYPSRPPSLFYHSYSSECLNPNLYVSGNVCVSLLGTWGGKQNELWDPSSSNLLQVLLSVQGLILVSEPYFNEAGYEKQRQTLQGQENSKKYNEMVLVRVLESTIAMLERPHASFQHEIVNHWKSTAKRYVSRMSQLSGDGAYESVCSKANEPVDPPAGTPNDEGASSPPIQIDYPLLPLSQGCSLTMQKILNKLKQAFTNNGIDF